MARAAVPASFPITAASIHAYIRAGGTPGMVNADAGKREWLPFLDTYRTMCLAPQPEFRGVLEEIQEFFLTD